LLTGDTAQASAVIHDYICQEWVPVGVVTWAQGAEIFLEAMQDEDVPEWRSLLMYGAVRLAGVWRKP
jgi:hypothetical protein